MISYIWWWWIKVPSKWKIQNKFGSFSKNQEKKLEWSYFSRKGKNGNSNLILIFTWTDPNVKMAELKQLIFNLNAFRELRTLREIFHGVWKREHVDDDTSSNYFPHSCTLVETRLFFLSSLTDGIRKLVS